MLANWYSKYLDSNIFRYSGCGEGDNSRSHYYDQYFVKGFIDYVGKCNRFVPFKDQEVVNSSFALYLKLQNLKKPSNYRKALPNREASYISASKYDKAQPVLDEGAWELAGDWTLRHFYPFMGGSGVLDQETTIGELDKTTSCGYPWNLKFHNKGELLADARASAVISDYWNTISGGNCDRIIPIWTVSQKVEMRDVDKLRLNKIRTFTACPIELSVATNRLCLDMNNRFYASNNQTWSFVGSSTFLQGWDRLYRRLIIHPNAFELDESEYDSSLFGRALYGQQEIRWELLDSTYRTPSNARALGEVYDNIVHSVCVLENGELFQKHTGNPSGSSNTIVDNTMILFRLFAYAWIVLCKERGEKPDYEVFMANVEAALNGDDNTFTVSDTYVGLFNPTTIGRVWTEIGVTTKTPCSTPRPLKDVSFLSHTFDWDDDLSLWMPVPETEKVLASLLFNSKYNDNRWHYLRACALRITSYGNKECRKIIAGYIEFLNKEYSAQMYGSFNDIDIKHIRGLWRSDAAIEALYCGQEGLCSGALKSLICAA